MIGGRGRRAARAGAGACLAALVLACSQLAPEAQRRPAGGGSPVFDSSRAFEHIRQLVAIGPRTPGSSGSAQARAYVTRELKAIGLVPVEQPFDATTPLGVVRMANVVATVPGRGPGRIVLGGHYDTKIFREFRFVGANDGGSSTAMLIELARALKGRANKYPVDVVFFDGEEAAVEWVGGDHTYGSRRYVAAARKAGTLSEIRAMVLVDMVGDRNLRILRESQSTQWLTDAIWAAARRLGHGGVFVDDSQSVADDHLSFLEAGVPAVDIIDLDPSYARSRGLDPGSDAPWHTAADTIEAVSARSLQIVGDTLLAAWPDIERALARRSTN